MIRSHQKYLLSLALIIPLTFAFTLILYWKSLYHHSFKFVQKNYHINVLSSKIAFNGHLINDLIGITPNLEFTKAINYNDVEAVPFKETPRATLSSEPQNAPTPPIKMLDLYDKMNFENVDGGAWKQGFNITYNQNIWGSDHPLNVFIIPHSHCDPGWLKTFDEYLKQDTIPILDNIVHFMANETRMKFVFAEISYFSEWWHQTTPQNREIMKKLVANGQLELVNGAWVMNDEANTHYGAMIDQNIQGQIWLQQNLGVRPKHGWFIDPFGHSPVNAYLLRRLGFQSTLIQRVHYFVKKTFAQTKMLEFEWQQPWDERGENNLLTHMMPFYSYDAPHSCGPDPAVCCQFDFGRLPQAGLKFTCPWNRQPEMITADNVEERAHLLLDQYRKKAQLYRTNNLLVPLGDDFRYQKPTEWKYQMENYLRLMDYFTAHPELNVKVQFGTLSDYFQALDNTQNIPNLNNNNNEIETKTNFPIISGDFFTYADRDDNYWSGYYTSRPLYKQLGRVLETRLRSAEIFYSIANIHKVETSMANMNDNISEFKNNENGNNFEHNDLEIARNSLGLFQHHDGITGTARHHVMTDYYNRMIDALHKTDNLMVQSIKQLMLSNTQSMPKSVIENQNQNLSQQENPTKMDFITEFDGKHRLSNVPTFGHDEEYIKHQLYLTNSLTQSRHETLVLQSPTPLICLESYFPAQSDYSTHHWLKSQINPNINFTNTGISPIFTEGHSSETFLDENDYKYEILVDIEIPPLSITPINLFYYNPKMHSTNLNNIMDNGKNIPCVMSGALKMANISIWNVGDFRRHKIWMNVLQKLGFYVEDKTIDSASDHITLTRNDKTFQLNKESGYLQKIIENANIVDDETYTDVKISFGYYEARKSKETSGAYLFLPGSQKQTPLSTSYKDMALVISIIGIVESQVISHFPLVYQDFKTVYHNSHRISAMSKRYSYLTHRIKFNDLDALDDSITIENTIYLNDFVENSNKELAMNIDTSINNQEYFYTDNNGFHMQKRRYFSKLPIQANFYPMPTTAYLEGYTSTDSKLLIRMSILTAQPLGVANLNQGRLEVILDRRLIQDDNRGLQEPPIDNIPYTNRFRLVMEKSMPIVANGHIDDNTFGHWSAKSWRQSLQLLHPISILLTVDNVNQQIASKSYFCTSNNIHLVNLKTFNHSPSTYYGLTIHANVMDEHYMAPNFNQTYQINLSTLLSPHNEYLLEKTTLNYLDPIESVDTKFEKKYLKNIKASNNIYSSDMIQSLKPYELHAFKYQPTQK